MTHYAQTAGEDHQHDAAGAEYEYLNAEEESNADSETDYEALDHLTTYCVCVNESLVGPILQHSSALNVHFKDSVCLDSWNLGVDNF